MIFFAFLRNSAGYTGQVIGGSGYGFVAGGSIFTPT